MLFAGLLGEQLETPAPASETRARARVHSAASGFLWDRRAPVPLGPPACGLRPSVGLAAGAWSCVALSARPLSVRGETVGNTLTAECLQLSCGDDCTLARSCEKQQRESPCTLAQPPPKEHLAKLQSSPTAGQGQRGAALLEPLTCLRLSPPALQEGCGCGVRTGNPGGSPSPSASPRCPCPSSLLLAAGWRPRRGGGVRGMEVAPEAWRWRPRCGGGGFAPLPAEGHLTVVLPAFGSDG